MLLFPSIWFSLASAMPSSMSNGLTVKFLEEEEEKLKGKDHSIILPQFDFDPFELTNVTIQCGKKSPSEPVFDCNLGFNWEDPNSEANCSCRSMWQWDGISHEYGENNNYTVNYTGCSENGQELFQFKFQGMTDISAISLMLFRRWYDGKDFQPPRLTNVFALTNITLLTATTDDPSVDMASNLMGPLEAPINGLTL